MGQRRNNSGLLWLFPAGGLGSKGLEDSEPPSGAGKAVDKSRRSQHQRAADPAGPPCRVQLEGVINTAVGRGDVDGGVWPLGSRCQKCHRTSRGAGTSRPAQGRLSLPGVGGASHDPARTGTRLERARGREGPAGTRGHLSPGEEQGWKWRGEVLLPTTGCDSCASGWERLCHLSKAFLMIRARFIERIKCQGTVNLSERLGCPQGGVWRAREPGFPRPNSRWAPEGGRSPGQAPHVARRAAKPGAGGRMCPAHRENWLLDF